MGVITRNWEDSDLLIGNVLFINSIIFKVWWRDFSLNSQCWTHISYRHHWGNRCCSRTKLTKTLTCAKCLYELTLRRGLLCMWAEHSETVRQWMAGELTNLVSLFLGKNRIGVRITASVIWLPGFESRLPHFRVLRMKRAGQIHRLTPCLSATISLWVKWGLKKRLF